MKVGSIRLVRGKVDFDQADAAWPRESLKTGRPRKPEETTTAPEPSKELTPHQRKAQAEAEKTELALAKARGDVVPVEDITRTARDFARRIHDALLDVPEVVQRIIEHSACRSCGVSPDAKAVALEVEKEMRELLDVLAGDPMGQG